MSRMIDDEETLKDNGLIEIDGVDVSECMYFDNAMCQAEKRSDGNTITECFGFTCYFKRLQQLKAGNERLKQPSLVVPKPRQTGVPIEEYLKLKQALEEVREIAYTTDFDIADIQKICNEVLKDEQ